MVKVGDKIKILNQNGQYTQWAKRKWTITKIYHDDTEHQGYDMGVYPEKLIECEDLPVALYEYEIEVVN